MRLKRLIIDPTTLGVSNSDQCHKQSGQSETVEVLSNKGNDGFSANPHTCSFCQKAFKSRYRLRMHIEGVQCKTRKRFCDLCPKYYFTRNAIRGHMKSVHGKKRFACNICDYKTAAKNTFKRHKVTHAIKVECPICKKPIAELKSHIRNTHTAKVQCSICRKLMNRSTIPRHMKTHVQKCKTCDEVCTDKEDLRRCAKEKKILRF